MSKLLRQNVGGTDYSMAGCALSATCTTAAAAAAKVAELTDGDVLADGMSVAIQFTNGNTAASPLTLTVGGVTANICDSRGQNIGGNIWQTGNVVTFLYTFGKFLLLNCVVDEVTLNNMNSVSSNAVANMVKKYSITQTITARTLQNDESVLIDVPITVNKFYVGGIYYNGLPTEDLTLMFNDYSGRFASSINSNYSSFKLLDVIGKSYQDTLHILLTNYTGHSVTLGDITFIFNYLEFSI